MHIEDASDLTVRAWRTLEDERTGLGFPNLRVQTVPQFLLSVTEDRLTRADRDAILDQAALFFEHLYPHLPAKQRLFPDAKPLEALNTIRGILDTLSDVDFHICMLLAFATVHDIHTAYMLPPPYRGGVSLLPFQVRFYEEDGKRRYIVTRVMDTTKDAGFEHEFFGPGAEILMWDGTPIESAVWTAAQLQPGANAAALSARGVGRLTVRPLSSTGLLGAGGIPPFRFQEKATLSYIPAGKSEVRGISFPWGVATGLRASGGLPSAAFSANESLAMTATACKVLWGRKQIHTGPLAPAVAPQEGSAPDLKQVSSIPKVFQFQHSGGLPQEEFTNPADLTDQLHPGKKFGHIRIRTFADDLPALGAAKRLLTEFKRILTFMNEVAPDGLIVDVRNNPGGHIDAAERMLQMLTPRPIAPVLFHLANTPVVLRILELARDGSRNRSRLPARESVRISNAVAELEPWFEALSGAKPEDTLTLGRPLTSREAANDIGQVYQGPVVLLIDAITYSAADIFAAGFQDNGIGIVIGADSSTGAGGANVWRHGDLLNNVPSTAELPARVLPGDVDMSFAIRRVSRTGRHAGEPLEDHGVVPDELYLRTLEDLTSNAGALVRFACAILGKQEPRRVEVSDVEITSEEIRVSLRTQNIESLVCFVDGARMKEASGRVESLAIARPAGSPKPRRLRIEGFTAAAELGAVTTVDLLGASSPSRRVAGAG